jgi:hypothetical protein
VFAVLFENRIWKLSSVIPGRAQREPGIHNHQPGVWIPGLRASHASRNDKEDS